MRREDESTWAAEQVHSRERRAAGARLLVDVPVTLIVDGFPHTCRTADLSLSGMVVELSKSLASREAHIVYAYELDLEGRRVRVVGRTAWRRGALQGVRFIEVSADDQQRLLDFLHQVRQRRASDLERLELAEHLDRLRAIGRRKPAA